MYNLFRSHCNTSNITKGIHLTIDNLELIIFSFCVNGQLVYVKLMTCYLHLITLFFNLRYVISLDIGRLPKVELVLVDQKVIFFVLPYVSDISRTGLT